jgi:hypothetical protein
MTFAKRNKISKPAPALAAALLSIALFTAPLSAAAQVIWFNGQKLVDASERQQQAASGGLIVRIQPGQTAEVIAAITQKGLQSRKMALPDTLLVETPPGAAGLQLSLKLQGISGILDIEPNWRLPLAPR